MNLIAPHVPAVPNAPYVVAGITGVSITDVTSTVAVRNAVTDPSDVICQV